MEADWNGQVHVVRLNVHEDGAAPLLQRFDFRFTPTFILLDGQGQEVWRRIGSLEAGEVQTIAAGLQESS